MKKQTTPLYLICNIGTFCALPSEPTVYPYHLILAQLWADSPEYRQAVIDLRSRAQALNVSLDIILDNGAHEGLIMSPAEYLKITKACKPDCVVLPDLIGKRSTESQARGLIFASDLDPGDAERCMYVPQGEDKLDILGDFKWAQGNLSKTQYTIGLGQSYLTWEREGLTQEAARLELINQVLQLPNAQRARYHVLGARWDYRNLSEPLFTRAPVWGLDTIKPCTCALHGALYPINPGIPIDRFSKSVAPMGLLWSNMEQLCSCYGLSTDGMAKFGPECFNCHAKMLNRSTHYECTVCGSKGALNFLED